MTKEKLRPALQPAVTLGDDYARGKDAEITVALEVLPEIAAPSIDGLKLERLTVAAGDAAVMAKIDEFAEQMKRFEDAPQTKQAAAGKQVILDFAGSVEARKSVVWGRRVSGRVDLGGRRRIKKKKH